MKTDTQESYTEYSVITDNDELHTTDRNEAQDYYDALSYDDKESCQYFSKKWVCVDNNFVEDDVELLK